ncbi:hypothetical protein ACS0TY_029608 [Phlomoides rotata]
MRPTAEEGLSFNLGLCVPHDRLEDIDFYPNFNDDLIKLSEELELDVFLPDINGEQECDSRELSSHYSFDDNLVMKKPRTKKRRKGNQRWCGHCGAEKTPQWRLGPKGPNTLCNACGLRYKLGRLVPDYRPASSPTFDRTKHSNYYKRLMRQNMKKMIRGRW